jgi:heme/copper-type cytochrome/quinol oxidase subunit 2
LVIFIHFSVRHIVTGFRCDTLDSNCTVCPEGGFDFLPSTVPEEPEKDKKSSFGIIFILIVVVVFAVLAYFIRKYMKARANGR